MNIGFHLRRFGVFFLRIIPLQLADKIATLLGRLFYLVLKKRRGYIEKNLYYVFSDQHVAPGRIRHYVRNTFVNYGRTMVDFLRLGFVNREDFSVELIGIENAREALKLNRGCVLLTLHIGNWDYAGAFLASRGIPMTALVEEIDPAMLGLYTRHRERTGMKTFPVSKAGYAFIDTMKNNRVLAILGDRDVVGNGVPVTFFSGRRKIPKGLGEIIIKKKLPVVFGYMVLNPSKKQRYLGVIEPVRLFTAGVEEFNACIVRKFEEIIRTYPDQWIAFHPEWIE
jgi:lauroyl/myristoyl acyltransferase